MFSHNQEVPEFAWTQNEADGEVCENHQSNVPKEE